MKSYPSFLSLLISLLFQTSLYFRGFSSLTSTLRRSPYRPLTTHTRMFLTCTIQPTSILLPSSHSSAPHSLPRYQVPSVGVRDVEVPVPHQKFGNFVSTTLGSHRHGAAGLSRYHLLFYQSNRQQRNGYLFSQVSHTPVRAQHLYTDR